MMQIISQWRVTANFEGRGGVQIWIYDNHLANVLRKLADIQFSENGLEQPREMIVELCKEANQMLGAGILSSSK